MSIVLRCTARMLTRDRTCAMVSLIAYGEFLGEGALHFALLWSPQVYRDGQLLVFPSHKALVLLLYLAVEQGAIHAKRSRSCSGLRVMPPMYGRHFAQPWLSYATC